METTEKKFTKAQLQEINGLLGEEIIELKESMDKLVEESIALGEDMRGRPFILEDIEGFTTTAIDNEHKTHTEREIHSLDNFHICRGKDNIWHIVTPQEITVPVEINDMFEGIMILRALGLKRITFQGLLEDSEMVEELLDMRDDVRKMRDERVAKEKEDGVYAVGDWILDVNDNIIQIYADDMMEVSENDIVRHATEEEIKSQNQDEK